MASHPELHIHTDGASRGNPGEAAFAYVIDVPGASPIEEAGRLGKMTNNQAEYTALVRALKHAAQVGTGYSLIIHSDSELMVKQMRGEYKVKNPELRDLYEQACELAGRFPAVSYRHVRREHNKRADQLCNEALDGLREASFDTDSVTQEASQVSKVAAAQVSLQEEAVQVLRNAGVGAAPEVWQRLTQVLARHGVQLPTGKSL
jgi:ribonuclease HI